MHERPLRLVVLLLAFLLAACGGAALSPSGPRPVPFSEVTSVQNSTHDDAAAAVVVGMDAARSIVGASAPAGRVLVAVFQGAQRTGGYGISVERIERDGDRLIVHAGFAEPGPGAFVTQVLTSPAHAVSIAAADAAGVRIVLLRDAGGVERARATVP